MKNENKIRPGQRWRSINRNLIIKIIKQSHKLNGKGWIVEQHSGNTHHVAEFVIFHEYILIKEIK